MNYFLFAVSDCAVCVNQSKVASLIHTSEKPTHCLPVPAATPVSFTYTYTAT